MGDYLNLKPGPFQQTSIQGGLPKLVRIWKYLREKIAGGYGSGRLVSMKNGPTATGDKTDCSPFTATVIYMALDPREVDVDQPFFFSSRRRHPIFDCDWSSDVCSSD